MIYSITLARLLRSKVEELGELRVLMRIQLNWLAMKSRVERKGRKERGAMGLREDGNTQGSQILMKEEDSKSRWYSEPRMPEFRILEEEQFQIQIR